MANYYSMQEVMEKLRKTEQEVQGLVKQGQLRQYLDSGKPVFKVEDVDSIAQEVVGIDLSSAGLTLEEGTQLDLQLEETGEIRLEPDESHGAKDKKQNEEIDLEKPLTPESEGGFGLSQMGDLTMADTNVGTVGINILSGTDDAYKLTEDTKAETQAEEVQLEEASAEAPVEEVESLDADSNLESFGSGSGLLDLSLQADDTSLGAVLDDILPTGAEGAGPEAPEMPLDQGIGLMDEEEAQPQGERIAVGMAAQGAAQPMAGPVVIPGAQVVTVVPVDPRTNIFGVAMFLPFAALVIAAIVMTSAIQGVVPSILKPLWKNSFADIPLVWVISGGLIVLMLLILLFAAAMGGEKTPKVKKEKAPKPAKAPKAKVEKPVKKRK